MLLWTWLKNMGSYFEAEGCQIVEAQFEKGASLLNPIVRSGPAPPLCLTPISCFNRNMQVFKKYILEGKVLTGVRWIYFGKPKW